jgi:hypothetical protein
LEAHGFRHRRAALAAGGDPIREGPVHEGRGEGDVAAHPRAGLSRTILAAALLCLAWPAAATGQSGAEDPARLRVLELLGRCESAPGDEIVVCGARRDPDRYRLPEFSRNAAAAAAGAGHVRGEAPRASTDVAPPRGCGIFQHQRRCSRAEMAEAGYFEGRDPASFLRDLITILADPDADVRPPPPIP